MKKSLVLIVSLLGLLFGFEGLGGAATFGVSLIAPLPLIAYPVRTTLLTIENDVPNGTVTIPLPPPTSDAMLGWDYTTDPVHPVPIYYALGSGFTRTAATNNAGATISVSGGATGANGLSAYQVWLANGNTGTQTQFLTSLVSTVAGPPGATGAAGSNGSPYVPGGLTTQYIRGDGSFATFPAIPAAQVQSDWNATTGLGVILNKPTFNFGAPNVRTVAVSTAYQATDPTKADIVTVSPSCQNATTVLASSACTMQVRQSATTGLTCSTGTVTASWTSLVNLGLVFTQTSGSPLTVHLPIGGYFILCATSGTFTISAVDQSAG